jgi:hypothetical protein
MVFGDKRPLRCKIQVLRLSPSSKGIEALRKLRRAFCEWIGEKTPLDLPFIRFARGEKGSAFSAQVFTCWGQARKPDLHRQAFQQANSYDSIFQIPRLDSFVYPDRRQGPGNHDFGGTEHFAFPEIPFFNFAGDGRLRILMAGFRINCLV